MKLHVNLFSFFLLFFAFHGHSQGTEAIMSRTIQHVQNSNEHLMNRHWDSVQFELIELSGIAEEHPTNFTRGLYQMQTGIYAKQRRDFDEAVEVLNQSFDLFKADKNDTLMGVSLNHLGEVYRMLELNEMSLSSYREAKSLMIKTDNFRQLSFTLSNLANYFKKNRQLDSAAFYYNQSIGLKKVHNIKGKGKTLNNLAGVYYMMDDLATSREMYVQAMQEAKAENDTSFISYPLIELAVIDIETGNFSSAKEVLDRVSSLSLDSKSQLRFFEVMSYFFSEKGDFEEALDWKNKHFQFYRGYINEIRTKSIQNLNVHYETERKNTKIEAQNLKLDIQEQKIQLKNTQVGVLIAGLLLVIFTTFILIQGIRRKNKIRTLQARFDGEKSIKTSIGKNLHDFVAPELTSARMKLELFQLKQPSPEIGAIIHQLNESSENIRNMSHQLSPMIYRLKVSSFNDIVKNALLEFKRYTNIDVQLNLPFPILLNDLSEEDQENIYGITLECLNNVRRHSKATKLIFSIHEKNNHFLITLMDNGVGLNGQTTNGIGFENLKSRADLLRGTISIESSDSGLDVQLTFPKS
jgi:two-component system NarL family sensor kinase